MIIDSITVKNNVTRYDNEKPLEDYLLCDKNNGIFIVSDGVSREAIMIDGKKIYPTPSPAAKVAKLSVKACHDYILNNETLDFRAAFIAANDAAGEYNRNISDHLKSIGHEWLIPGAVMIGVRIQGNILHYGFAGDLMGIHIRDNIPQFFSEDQVKLMMENLHLYPNRRDNSAATNNLDHPHHFPNINGDKRFEHYIKTGTIELLEGDIILLMSDGLDPLIDYIDEYWTLSCEEMAQKAEELEQNHNLRTDDKAIIKITI